MVDATHHPTMIQKNAGENTDSMNVAHPCAPHTSHTGDQGQDVASRR